MTSWPGPGVSTKVIGAVEVIRGPMIPQKNLAPGGVVGPGFTTQLAHLVAVRERSSGFLFPTSIESLKRVLPTWKIRSFGPGFTSAARVTVKYAEPLTLIWA